MSIPDLYGDLEYLESLDALRGRAKRLRDGGLLALSRCGAKEDAAFWLNDNKFAIGQVLLHRSKQIAHSLGYKPKTQSELPKVLLAKDKAASRQKKLILEKEDASVFLAAAYLRAELDNADQSLTHSFFLCMYWVTREIYTFDSPGCPFGGARADKDSGLASAFVTQECARALGYLARKADRTAEFLELSLRAISYVNTILGNQQAGYLKEAWCSLELQREKMNIESLVEAHAGRILLGLQQIHLECEVQKFAEVLEQLVRSFLEDTAKSIEQAIETCEAFRGDERTAAKADLDQSRLFGLSESAHINMVGTLRVLAKGLKEISSLEGRILGKAAQWFRQTGRSVRRLLEPVRLYMRETLNAAIFEADVGRSFKRLRDIALVVAPLGRMEGSWADPVFERALKLLVGGISEYGELPLGEAFKQRPEGYQRLAVNANALRALAELIQHIPSPVEASIVELMVRFFERWQVPIGESGIGWCRESHPGKASVWLSCISVNALNRIVRMLDSKINERLAIHFAIERPEDLRGVPRIQDLVCTDVGISSCDWTGVAKRERILLTADLERMRSHLVRHPLREGPGTTCSVILYGPPGTGKTTIIESLALTTGVPLIRITPSDFLIAGAEKMEGRGKAVMRALSMSTRVVILFDEFDPVLTDRRYIDHPSSVFSFLTGAMLPRLTHLNHAAKENRFVYALATNYIDRLDVAAIRPGRFDEKRGVYPPDAASRICRLISQLRQWAAKNPKERKVPFESDAFWQKLALVVAKTASLSTVVLMREGWLRPLKEFQQSDDKKPKTPWHFLIEEKFGLASEQDIWWPMPGDLGQDQNEGSSKPALSEAGSKAQEIQSSDSSPAKGQAIQTLVALDQKAEQRMVWEWNNRLNILVKDPDKLNREALLDAAAESAEISKVMLWWNNEHSKLRANRLGQAHGGFELP